MLPSPTKTPSYSSPPSSSSFLRLESSSFCNSFSRSANKITISYHTHNFFFVGGKIPLLSSVAKSMSFPAEGFTLEGRDSGSKKKHTTNMMPLNILLVRQGNKKGCLPKIPSGRNRNGSLSAGWAKRPPITGPAELSVSISRNFIFHKERTDASYSPHHPHKGKRLSAIGGIRNIS